MVVAELVREHRLELLHGQRLHQRQADAHDAPAAEAHDAAALRHERVHVVDQIDMRGHRLLGGRRPRSFSTSNSCGESTALSGGPGATKRSMRGSTAQMMVPARADTHQGDLDWQPHVVGVRLVGNPQQRSGDAERERVEAHHQHHRERGTLHQPGCLFHGTLSIGQV